MADGLAGPGRLRILPVFGVEIGPTHLMVALPDHPDLLRGLDEIEWLKKQQLTGGAAGPTPGLGRESAMSLFYQFVVHAHLGGRPGGWIGILAVSETLDTGRHASACGRCNRAPTP